MDLRRGQLWTLLLLLGAFSSVAENDVSSVKRQNCGNQKFLCQSGECIEPFQVCDGPADCSDKSDENQETCMSRRCPDGFFRCGYGACVHEKAACDGTIQCEGDGSDEASELCGTSPLVPQSNKSESVIEVCGIPAPKPHVFDGKPMLVADFPWHVGIYRKESGTFREICGGSIINRKLVLTAAHCFVNSHNPKDYMIGAGKYHRSWDVTDPTEQRREVESIEIKDTYQGMSRNYADDIAIIVLKTEIIVSAFVRPVCLDLESKYVSGQLSSGTLGSIAHWSFNENGEPNDALITTKLPFIEFAKCLKLLPISFKPFFSSEKFCAGYVNRSTICPGDTGGGLTFEQEVNAKTKQWFIQGIASLGTPSRNGNLCTHFPVLFTEVNKHMNWLKTYYDKY